MRESYSPPLLVLPAEPLTCEFTEVTLTLMQEALVQADNY